jgi:membrane-associated phospholipid phosphatase
MLSENIKPVVELYEHFEDLFWGIGYFGWQLSALYALNVSFNHSLTAFALYIVVFLFSGWANHLVLKDYIKDPRPADSKPFLASEHFKKHTNGMPSGHAQQTAFSLLFSYLITGRYLYESLALFLLTVAQRYVYKNHTISQLLVGGLLGGTIAYIAFYILSRVNK